MNPILVKVTTKINGAPGVAVFGIVAACMSIASFTGLIYHHGTVLGIFWAVGAIVNLGYLAVTR